jgi:hypothetical protein
MFCSSATDPRRYEMPRPRTRVRAQRAQRFTDRERPRSGGDRWSVRHRRNVLRRGKVVMRVEAISSAAEEKVGPLDQRATEDVLVETRVVGGGNEDRPESLRRRVVAGCVTTVVVGVPVRHGFLVVCDLLDGDVCSRHPRPRRNRLGERDGQHQGVHRRCAPRSTAHGTTHHITRDSVPAGPRAAHPPFGLRSGRSPSRCPQLVPRVVKRRHDVMASRIGGRLLRHARQEPKTEL